MHSVTRKENLVANKFIGMNTAAGEKCADPVNGSDLNLSEYISKDMATQIV